MCSREYATLPVFALTSATSADPAAHARALLGVQKVQFSPSLRSCILNMQIVQPFQKFEARVPHLYALVVVTGFQVAWYLQVWLTKLAGAQVHVVDQDGSPHGPRLFVLWNPPLVKNAGPFGGQPRAAGVAKGGGPGRKLRAIEEKRAKQEAARAAVRTKNRRGESSVRLVC